MCQQLVKMQNNQRGDGISRRSKRMLSRQVEISQVTLSMKYSGPLLVFKDWRWKIWNQSLIGWRRNFTLKGLAFHLHTPSHSCTRNLTIHAYLLLTISWIPNVVKWSITWNNSCMVSYGGRMVTGVEGFLIGWYRKNLHASAAVWGFKVKLLKDMHEALMSKQPWGFWQTLV